MIHRRSPFARWTEHQDPRAGRCARQRRRHRPFTGVDRRHHRRPTPAGWAQFQRPDRRRRLRRRLSCPASAPGGHRGRRSFHSKPPTLDPRCLRIPRTKSAHVSRLTHCTLTTLTKKHICLLLLCACVWSGLTMEQGRGPAHGARAVKKCSRQSKAGDNGYRRFHL